MLGDCAKVRARALAAGGGQAADAMESFATEEKTEVHRIWYQSCHRGGQPDGGIHRLADLRRTR
jgi:hypothetical protein